MKQITAYLLIILIGAGLYADATWHEWTYSLWAAKHFTEFVQALKFWR